MQESTSVTAGSSNMKNSAAGAVTVGGSPVQQSPEVRLQDCCPGCLRGANPIREYYDHLLAQGVAEHNARHAVARYIARISYGMLKSGTRYEPYRWKARYRKSYKRVSHIVAARFTGLRAAPRGSERSLIMMGLQSWRESSRVSMRTLSALQQRQTPVSWLTPSRVYSNLP